MVWARTKLVIKDRIFDPVRTLNISYSGPNSKKFYNRIREKAIEIYDVPEGYLQEKTFTWEKQKSGDHKFAAEWELNKIMDIWSYINVRIMLKGFSSENEGWATIKIEPFFFTEYPQDTVWQNNIIYELLRRIWHAAFYHKKRMQYFDKGKELSVKFADDLKKYSEELK